MKAALLIAAALIAAAGIAVWQLAPRDRQGAEAPPPAYTPAADPVQRGHELVTLADCKSCHTVPGGAPFAGGRGIPTSFGTFYSPNITPDVETGIGSWTKADFWRALHDGYSRDGTPLYPAFPYTNYTQISRRDADAMFAYLRTLRPIAQKSRPHELRFPYNHRSLLLAWRFLFFQPGVYRPDPLKSAEWNRGAYLVRGAGHCSACHEARNALGAVRSQRSLSGGLVQSWYAPSLTDPREAGLREWSIEDIITLLQSGRVGGRSPRSPHGSTMGPMAEVVFGSLQYAHHEDLRAMAVYLEALPEASPRPERGFFSLPYVASAATLDSGRVLYGRYCARCHGDDGEGHPPVAPPLSGNRVVTMSSDVDLIRIVLFGGYPPGTAGDPRPFGMPPYYPTLSDDQIAAVLTYIRASWQNTAAPIQGDRIGANRGNPM